MGVTLIVKGKLQDPYGTHKDSETARQIKRRGGNNWIEGWWENIGPDPIYIKDKAHLKRECQKRGVIPKAFMKSKSQGKGFEWTY